MSSGPWRNVPYDFVLVSPAFLAMSVSLTRMILVIRGKWP